MSNASRSSSIAATTSISSASTARPAQVAAMKAASYKTNSAASTKTHAAAIAAGDATSTKSAAVAVPPNAAIRKKRTAPAHQSSTIEVTVPPGSKLGLVLEERPDGLFVIVTVQETCPFRSLAKRGDFISLVDGMAPTDFVDFTRNQERQRTLTIERQRTLTIAPEEHPPNKTADTSDPPRKKRRLRSHASSTHGKQIILVQEVHAFT